MLRYKHEEANYCICSFIIGTLLFLTNRVYNLPFDTSRNRVIPLAVYQPHKVNLKTKVIIFSHGYDGNKNNKSNQTYAYLTRFLSQKGFYVISIQHELVDDPLLAMEGNFMETRMPNWERGVANILLLFRNLRN